jgi:hypothetical protein
VSLKVGDQFGTFAPGHPRLRGRQGCQPLVDLQRQIGRTDSRGQLQLEQSFQIGVADAGLDQQVGEASAPRAARLAADRVFFRAGRGSRTRGVWP